ncbi:hypothetical protein BU26DRAFT_307666 [Trematosphaeria pertusa]|uniref:Uncharacterized protein n=1 Tax=Trematosphaeria pertusa TaxID=390896 RepID=A0A6A6IE37_9PLEO|nr:uncharacterized protein BU26DRAFT_307666 [Trematosphaeria pertusa]KAF2248844.1 hypothetical protein BU26DRAFT_307666 [Trematosphaeria pertusa]
MGQFESTPTSHTNSYFVPTSTGIDRVVITTDIQRYLGPDATVRSAELDGQAGYKVTASLTLTAQMIQDMKGNSEYWRQEQRRTEGAGSYENSRTRAEQWGPERGQRHDGQQEGPDQNARYESARYASTPSPYETARYTTSPATSHGYRPSPYGGHARPWYASEQQSEYTAPDDWRYPPAQNAYAEYDSASAHAGYRKTSHSSAEDPYPGLRPQSYFSAFDGYCKGHGALLPCARH